LWVVHSGGDAHEARDASIRHGSITALVLAVVFALVTATG